MFRSWTILSAIALLAMASGCSNKVKTENAALRTQNQELQSQLSDSQNRLRSAPDPGTLTSMQQQIAERDAKIAELQGQLRSPQAGQTDNSLAGIEVTRDSVAGTVTVALPGDVLFDPGHADLKSSAKSTLNKVVAAVKKDYPNKTIMVDGYTDSDPITRTKNKWDDNLDLSAGRARTVAQYLVTEGISTRLVHPRAMGDTHPRTSKSASRRVEIVVATR